MKKMYITGSLKNSLSNVIENLCNTLSSPSAVYRVQDTEVVFNSSSLVGLPNESVCSRLLDLTTSDEDEFVSGKQKHSKSYKQVRVAQVVTFFFISNINWTKTKPIRPAKNYTSFKWSSNEWKQFERDFTSLNTVHSWVLWMGYKFIKCGTCSTGTVNKYS